MVSMGSWRFAQELHCYDPVSRGIRITIAGTVTALGLGIPLTRIAMRAALPIAAIAVVPYIFLIERHTVVNISDWNHQPFGSSMQLLVTLIPPSLFLGVCLLVDKRIAKRNTWWHRYPVITGLARWELQSTHPAIAFTLYSVSLVSIFAFIYWQLTHRTNLSSSIIQSVLFIGSMFLFARLAVGTWRSLIRYRDRGLFAKCVGGLGQGSIILTGISVMVISLFEAPLASVAIARAAEKMGAPVWQVRVDGTVLSITGDFAAGIADAATKAIERNRGLRTVELDSPGGFVEEATPIANAVRAHHLATEVSRECSSACTFVFVAGRERLLLPPGRLGFHDCRGNTWLDECDEKGVLEFFKSMGIDEKFVKKGQRVPSADIWYPTTQELLAAHVITGTELPPQRKSPALAANAQGRQSVPASKDHALVY